MEMDASEERLEFKSHDEAIMWITSPMQLL